MTVAAPNNSTNVRNSRAGWSLALGLGARLAPRWTAERMIDRFLATSRRRSGPEQERFRASGERLVLPSGLVARSFGEGPAVALLHGWNGSLTDFRLLVPRLVSAGFRAVAVDAAGHGESEGDQSSAIHLARALDELGEAIGPAEAVIAHSLGAAAAALAVSRGSVRTERLVLISPAAEPSGYVDRMARDLGPEFAARLQRTLERRVGVASVALGLSRSSRRIGQPALVVHDTEDRETPLAPVVRAVGGWPSAQLVLTDGLGHRRILADPSVAEAIVGALKGTNVRVCVHRRLPDRCSACALERELYRRGERAA